MSHTKKPSEYKLFGPKEAYTVLDNNGIPHHFKAGEGVPLASDLLRDAADLIQRTSDTLVGAKTVAAQKVSAQAHAISSFAGHVASSASQRASAAATAASQQAHAVATEVSEQVISAAHAQAKVAKQNVSHDLARAEQAASAAQALAKQAKEKASDAIDKRLGALAHERNRDEKVVSTESQAVKAIKDAYKSVVKYIARSLGFVGRQIKALVTGKKTSGPKPGSSASAASATHPQSFISPDAQSTFEAGYPSTGGPESPLGAAPVTAASAYSVPAGAESSSVTSNRESTPPTVIRTRGRVISTSRPVSNAGGTDSNSPNSPTLSDSPETPEKILPVFTKQAPSSSTILRPVAMRLAHVSPTPSTTSSSCETPSPAQATQDTCAINNTVTSVSQRGKWGQPSTPSLVNSPMSVFNHYEAPEDALASVASSAVPTPSPKVVTVSVRERSPITNYREVSPSVARSKNEATVVSDTADSPLSFHSCMSPPVSPTSPGNISETSTHWPTSPRNPRS